MKQRYRMTFVFVVFLLFILLPQIIDVYIDSLSMCFLVLVLLHYVITCTCICTIFSITCTFIIPHIIVMLVCTVHVYKSALGLNKFSFAPVIEQAT